MTTKKLCVLVNQWVFLNDEFRRSENSMCGSFLSIQNRVHTQETIHVPTQEQISPRELEIS